MALQDYPQLHRLFNELSERKEAIEQRLAPIRAEYEAIHQRISPEVAKLRELGREMKRIRESDQLVNICNEMSAIARSTGGRAISDATQ